MNKRPTLDQVVRSMTRFIIFTFVICGVLSAVSAYGYYRWSVSQEKVFHTIVIFAAMGYTFPMFTISIRVMIKLFFMTCEGMQNTDKLFEGYEKAQATIAPMAENIKAIIEKAVPIANNVEVIVDRAKGMADDIEKVAHKVRSAADSLNGHLDIKELGKKLDKVAESLNTIAGAFGGGSIDEKEEVGLTFDPLVKVGRKSRQA